jgi:hypothetical protein
MLEDQQNKVAGDREMARITPQKRLNQPAQPDTSMDNTATKKRSRDDMMIGGEMGIGVSSAEGPQIEKLMG